ncbi:MAG TPA: hypothetical protein VEC99_13895, partial [Clostridia bacterium]|nr:hypothetical protein [Clostridia bacterium]
MSRPMHYGIGVVLALVCFLCAYMGLMVFIGAAAHPGGGGRGFVALFVILALASGCGALLSFLAGSRLPHNEFGARVSLAVPADN